MQVDLADGSGLEVRIRNRGTVPLELRTCFFQKYKTSGKPGGTGLGTYSAKLFAEVMGFGLTMTTSDAENVTEIRLLIPELLRAYPSPEFEEARNPEAHPGEPATWAGTPASGHGASQG